MFNPSHSTPFIIYQKSRSTLQTIIHHHEWSRLWLKLPLIGTREIWRELAREREESFIYFGSQQYAVYKWRNKALMSDLVVIQTC